MPRAIGIFITIIIIIFFFISSRLRRSLHAYIVYTYNVPKYTVLRCPGRRSSLSSSPDGRDFGDPMFFIFISL